MNNKFGNEYIQINNNLFLTEYSFISLDDTLKKKLVRDPVNHIFLYDRSGSMYGLLNKLIEDLCERIKKIPVGDTITFGWFSGEGQKNFIIKGFKVTEEKDYSLLEKILLANNTTIGCTCFSEILKDTKQVIEDLSVFSQYFSLVFFTDGYPVVSSYTREIQEINSVIEELSNKITSSLLVGYGDYYNKQLMSDMAEKIGGSLTHTNNLPAFSMSLESFMKTAQVSKKINVKLINDINQDTIIFNINKDNINLYTANKDNEVNISCDDNEKVSLFVLTNTKPKRIKITKSNKSFEKALYAAAFILTQKTKTDIAIDVLGSLGDKKLIDMVTNSFTNAEYGATEESIRNAVVDTSKRFLGGKISGYVPPVDAFCLLDLLDILAADKEAYFYPRNECFIYKRIGKQSLPDEKYPKFKADPQSKASFADVVWNETKLNLSLRAVLQGTIHLPDEAKKYNLSQKYNTYQYKNYTFVKDGVLNVTNVPSTFSEATYNILVKKGVLDLSGVLTDKDGKHSYEKDRIYVLKLDAVPIVNRKIAEGKTSATELCKLVIQEQKLKATLKSLKYFRDQDFPEKEITAATAKTFIEKQQAFLEALGINTKTGAYEPPVIDSESTDFYFAKEFIIKVKGLSSLPKIEVVTAKMKDNKKLTTSDVLVSAGIIMYQNETKPSLEWFTNKILELSNELKKVRRQIQETKFAVLLCKKWFTEFSSREENQLIIDGFEFTISLTEKKVAV